MDGASTGTLSSARRSPNWTLPSMSTVRWSSWARATARLKAIVVLPTPPLGAKTDMTFVAATAELAANSFRTLAIRFMRSNPENGIASTPWMPLRRVDLDRVLRDGQDDDRDAETGGMDLLDELGPLDPALEQRVDEDDVRAELADLLERLAAIGQHVEELDRLLRVQEPPDVLRHLRHVLDDEQAGLVLARTARHRGRRYHGAPTGRAGPCSARR